MEMLNTFWLITLLYDLLVFCDTIAKFILTMYGIFSTFEVLSVEKRFCTKYSRIVCFLDGLVENILSTTYILYVALKLNVIL